MQNLTIRNFCFILLENCLQFCSNSRQSSSKLNSRVSGVVFESKISKSLKLFFTIKNIFEKSYNSHHLNLIIRLWIYEKTHVNVFFAEKLYKISRRSKFFVIVNALCRINASHAVVQTKLFFTCFIPQNEKKNIKLFQSNKTFVPRHHDY